MKIEVELRTISRNGQVAIPKRFLEALGVAPLSKVQIIREKQGIVIRPSAMTRMSDRAFQEFLEAIRNRNRHTTSRQISKAIREVRRRA